MPLSWNEIKARAAALACDWADATDERAQVQSFEIAFFALASLLPAPAVPAQRARHTRAAAPAANAAGA